MCGVRVKNREEEEKGLITKHCFNYIKKMPYKLSIKILFMCGYENANYFGSNVEINLIVVHRCLLLYC